MHTFCTGAHLEERAQRETLKEEADALRETAAAEKEAHRHAVRQYVVEVELRIQLEAQVAEERSGKEHAVFLRSVAEKKILQLQVGPRSCPPWHVELCACMHDGTVLTDNPLLFPYSVYICTKLRGCCSGRS